MNTSALLYEVTLHVTAAAMPEYDAWLRAHVAEMLALPGFTGAVIHAGLEPAAAAGGTRVVHYHLQDEAAYRTYLREHAARMRAAGTARWGDAVRASRRLLQPLA